MAEQHVANSHTSDNSSVVTFSFDSKEIRTLVDEHDLLWFVAKDVALTLGYSNTRDAIFKHCKGGSEARLPTNGGMQTVKIIPESDVYRLITKSRLPEAERFERWVFEEVLPSIGRTGQYQHEQQPEPEKPALTASTPADRRPLRDAVETWVRSRYTKVNNSHFREAWAEVNEYMQVDSIKDIPVEHIPAAVQYVKRQIAPCSEDSPKALPTPAIQHDAILVALSETNSADDPKLCLQAAKLSLLRALYNSHGESIRRISYALNAVVEAEQHEIEKDTCHA